MHYSYALGPGPLSWGMGLPALLGHLPPDLRSFWVSFLHRYRTSYLQFFGDFFLYLEFPPSIFFYNS